MTRPYMSLESTRILLAGGSACLFIGTAAGTAAGGAAGTAAGTAAGGAAGRAAGKTGGVGWQEQSRTEQAGSHSLQPGLPRLTGQTLPLRLGQVLQLTGTVL